MQKSIRKQMYLLYFFYYNIITFCSEENKKLIIKIKIIKIKEED